MKNERDFPQSTAGEERTVPTVPALVDTHCHVHADDYGAGNRRGSGARRAGRGGAHARHLEATYGRAALPWRPRNSSLPPGCSPPWGFTRTRRRRNPPVPVEGKGIPEELRGLGPPRVAGDRRDRTRLPLRPFAARPAAEQLPRAYSFLRGGGAACHPRAGVTTTCAAILHESAGERMAPSSVCFSGTEDDARDFCRRWGTSSPSAARSHFRKTMRCARSSVNCRRSVSCWRPTHPG